VRYGINGASKEIPGEAAGDNSKGDTNHYADEDGDTGLLGHRGRKLTACEAKGLQHGQDSSSTAN
jgi:hypothetical protein